MPTLNEELDNICVMLAEDFEKSPKTMNLSGWFAVFDENGIVAWFPTMRDACRYRLDLINRRLNP